MIGCIRSSIASGECPLVTDVVRATAAAVAAAAEAATAAIMAAVIPKSLLCLESNTGELLGFTETGMGMKVGIQEGGWRTHSSVAWGTARLSLLRIGASVEGMLVSPESLSGRASGRGGPC